MRMPSSLAFSVAVVAFAAASLPASAEDGVFADKIVFGQATALEGPASALGLGMKQGLEAAFAEANKAGGVKGRKLELKSVDDGYEPTKSIEAVKKLLADDKVFAIAGAVGTPTSAATQPIANNAGVPFIGAFTGAEFLREPHKPLVMNIRASYFQETEAMVERLTKDLGATKIAIMYQDDAFGQAGLAGVKRALDKRQMQLAGEGTFERNTVAVKSALLSIKKADPDAVIMISPYKPAAEFIKLAKQLKLNATFVNISFVGSDALAKELGNEGAGVVVTQVVPFPMGANIPVVARYQAALKAVAAECAAGLHLARRLSRRPRHRRGAREGRRRADPREPHAGDREDRRVRSRRLQARLQRHQQSRLGRSVPHRHPGRRLVQGGRTPAEARHLIATCDRV